jgi:hypothetical protein
MPGPQLICVYQFKRLIGNFCIEQSGEEPDWTKIRVVNAWGAPGGDDRDGIYYEFCRATGQEFHDFKSASRSFNGVLVPNLNVEQHARLYMQPSRISGSRSSMASATAEQFSTAPWAVKERAILFQAHRRRLGRVLAAY